MRIVISLAAAVTMAIGVVSAPSMALAAKQPPRVQGQSCGAVSAKIGRAKTWQALYWGWRRDIFDRHNEQFMQAPCFTTQASCKAWLWWAQTDYPNEIVIHFCKTGQPYG